MLRKWTFGSAMLNYGLVGRWIGHLFKGRYAHAQISTSRAIWGESFVGWFAHYIIGVAFAACLIAIAGWPPTLGSCLVAGIVTSAAPFFILQPGMGMGIAASKTPRPNVARLNTFITHLTFGLGLYIGVRISPNQIPATPRLSEHRLVPAVLSQEDDSAFSQPNVDMMMACRGDL